MTDHVARLLARTMAGPGLLGLRFSELAARSSDLASLLSPDLASLLSPDRTSLVSSDRTSAGPSNQRQADAILVVRLTHGGSTHAHQPA
jgi:hypothetical protein